MSQKEEGVESSLTHTHTHKGGDKSRSEENGKSLLSWKPAERRAESDKKDDSPSFFSAA